MKIYSNGKDRVLTGTFPARFNLTKDGVDVPYLRTSKGSIRITGEIPEGELEVQEVTLPKKQKKEESKNILDNLYLSIISEADFDRLEEMQGKIEKTQSLLDKQAKMVESSAKEVIDREDINAKSIIQTNTALKEMAKVFGNEIQADRYEIAKTANRIKQDIFESSEISDAKLQSHENAKNPHKITKETIGLEKVDNTSDIDKPVSRATKKALDKKADKTDIEELDKKIKESGKKQDSIIRSIENANLYGGVGGNELPNGGKTGQALIKKSSKTGDYEWGDVGFDGVHNDLGGRDADKCHPISAIDGLQTALNDKYPTSNPNGYTSNVGTVTSVNNTSPDGNGNVSISIPSEVTETTVSNWGFTKNTGTVTSVNNTSPDGSGNVSLSVATPNPTNWCLPVRDANGAFADSILKQTSDGRSFGVFGEPDASTQYDKYFAIRGGRIRGYAAAANAYILQGYTDGSANSAIVNAVRSGKDDSGSQMIFGICNGSNSWAGTSFANSVFFGSLKDPGGQALKPMKFTVNSSGGGTPQITISTNGNVGIKNVNPTYDLDVSGTMNASTDIKINGSTINPKRFTGFSSSKTQTLKNVNGTLTWVDD